MCQVFFTSFCGGRWYRATRQATLCVLPTLSAPLHSVPFVLAPLVHIYVYNTIMLTFVCECVSLCKCITQTVCEQVYAAVQRCVRGVGSGSVCVSIG